MSAFGIVCLKKTTELNFSLISLAFKLVDRTSNNPLHRKNINRSLKKSVSL